MNSWWAMEHESLSCLKGTHTHKHTHSTKRIRKSSVINGWCPSMTGLFEDQNASAERSAEVRGLTQVFLMLTSEFIYSKLHWVKCVCLQFTWVVSDFPEGLGSDSPANGAVQRNSGLYKHEYATVCKILDCEQRISPCSISGTMSDW